MREGDEFKISLCYPRDLVASPQSFRERGGVIYCVRGVCK